MQSSKDDTLIIQLKELLKRERDALISGDLSAIPDLVEQKELLIADLSRSQHEGEDLESVKTRLLHNQAMLESAMEGIRAVANRMKELQEVRSGLQTYDRSGKRHQIGGGYKPKLEKRA